MGDFENYGREDMRQKSEEEKEQPDLFNTHVPSVWVKIILLSVAIGIGISIII